MLQQSNKHADAIRLGVVGLGLAGAFMIRAAVKHPKIVLQAAVDPLPAPRDAFARDFGTATYSSVEELCEDPEVEAIYIASPHEFHVSQACLALQSGKHVMVEKPLGLTEQECQRVVELQRATGLTVIVGHTHGFDPNVRELARLINSGRMGRLGMILNFNYTDFLYRPKRPEEMDVTRGGGITFNQVAHQIEIARVIANSAVRSVRATLGSLDRRRVTDGNCNAFLEFENGASASLIYSAYDFYDSDELCEWIGELGTRKTADNHGASRARFLDKESTEDSRKRDLAYGARSIPMELPYLPHFGVLIVTCERGDLRLTPSGLALYAKNGPEELPVPRCASIPGHGDALDELYRSVRRNVKSIFAAEWGRDTVRTILAVQRSSRERREIHLGSGREAR